MSITLIAELSMNYMGDMDLAKEMIVAAHASGANYVKFQTWKEKNLCKGPWDHDGRREIYKKAELTEEKHDILSSFCRETGIKFLTSCFSKDMLSLINQFSSSVKIPSTECGNKDLVDEAVDNFNTVFISTGASIDSEWERYARYQNVHLLHCVSSYPCPPENANLKRIEHIKKFTDRAGYSGHCIGPWDAMAAIAMGATVIEKHFTTDQNLPFRDNKFSITPEDFRSIRKFADDFPKMMRYHGTAYQNMELPVRNQYRGRWEYGK